MGEPYFPMIDEIEESLKQHEQVWGLFDEFNSSMEEFSKEEWIVFRSKTYRFEEFLSNWSKSVWRLWWRCSVKLIFIFQEKKKSRYLLLVICN